jgi:hypothetical protein
MDTVIDRPQSRAASLNPERKILQRRSTYSLGDELERVAETGTYDPEHVNEDGEPDERTERASLGHRKTLSAGDEIYHHDYIEEEEEEEEQQHEEEEYEEEREDLDDHEVIFAQPSTLLAELQVRKAQQKSRSRTAATAFPNGMHSTLLQLDAVEEVSRKNRKAKRIELAWEDPLVRSQDAAKEADDDDVPLGMLYKPKDGKARNKPGEGPDWQRPMGLIERRDLENNEPLSSRRRRLRGESPPRQAPRAHRQSMQALQPTISLPKEEDDEDPEAANETLGQRAWRLKTKDKLDSALTDVTPKNGARPLSTFSDDVLSQFKGLDVAEPADGDKEGSAAQPTLPEVPPEDETLGQRRARLQREREASGEAARPATASPTRPVLRSNNSLADLLSANPIGQRTQNKIAEPAQGTLLHANAQMQLKHKQDLSQQNFRSSSMMHDRPLVDANNMYHQQGRDIHGGGGGLIGINSYQSRPRNGGFAGGLYNHSGQPMPTSTLSSPILGMNNAGQFSSPPLEQTSHFATPHPQMNAAAYGAMPGMAMPMPGAAYGYGMPYGNNPMAMGMGMNMGMGMGMNMNMGMMAPGMAGMGMGAAGGGGGGAFFVDPNLKPDQRTAIDRWRMGIDS